MMHARGFQADHIGRLLDDEHNAVIALSVGTDGANQRLGQIKTHSTMTDVGLEVDDRPRQFIRFFRRLLEQVVRQPLSRAFSQPRQAAVWVAGCGISDLFYRLKIRIGPDFAP